MQVDQFEILSSKCSVKLVGLDAARGVLTKAELTASTNLSSESSKSELAWDGVVDHIRQLRVSDSYACREEEEKQRRDRGE